MTEPHSETYPLGRKCGLLLDGTTRLARDLRNAMVKSALYPGDLTCNRTLFHGSVVARARPRWSRARPPLIALQRVWTTWQMECGADHDRT